MLDRTKLNLSFVTETMHVTPLLPSRETLSDSYRKVNISKQMEIHPENIQQQRQHQDVGSSCICIRICICIWICACICICICSLYLYCGFCALVECGVESGKKDFE